MQRYNRIKAVLADKGKTSKWLATQIERDKSTVSRWCTNDMQPSIETLFKIAELLEVQARELLVEHEN